MNSVKKSKKRAKKREYRATIFGTAEHENIKAEQREKKKSTVLLFLALRNMKI